MAPPHRDARAASGVMEREDGSSLDAAALFEAMHARLLLIIEGLDSITLSPGDEGLGAVEIKDADSAVRMDVAADGVSNAAFVQSNSLATQDTLDLVRVAAQAALVLQTAIQADVEAVAHLVSADAGVVDAGTQRVTLADDDVLTLLNKTALELIDDIIVTVGSAFSGKVAAIGGPCESTVPTARANREGVEAWLNTIGQFVNPSHDLATGSDMVTDASPATMQKQFTTDSEWTALTTPGDVTSTRSVRDYKNLLISYTIATIDTSVGLIIWGSFDGGITFHPIWADTILAADAQDVAVPFVGIALTDVYCEFDAEAGGVAATVTWEMGAGN